VLCVEQSFTMSVEKLWKNKKKKDCVCFGSVWENLHMLTTWFANRILNFNETFLRQPIGNNVL